MHLQADRNSVSAVPAASFVCMSPLTVIRIIIYSLFNETGYEYRATEYLLTLVLHNPLVDSINMTVVRNYEVGFVPALLKVGSEILNDI
jgi:hypothetical protein